MNHLMIPRIAGLIALSTMEAGAVGCARGVVRAGCVAAGGAAIVTTALVVTAPVVRPAGAVVAPRAPVVRRRVCWQATTHQDAPSTIRGRDRGCAQANELEATAQNWMTNRATAAASRHTGDS